MSNVAKSRSDGDSVLDVSNLLIYAQAPYRTVPMTHTGNLELGLTERNLAMCLDYVIWCSPNVKTLVGWNNYASRLMIRSHAGNILLSIN